jgi:dTDP-4-amino-4,6-dideoxygalactose transaminase
MAQGIYRITEQFEEELCKYTGSRFCITTDNATNALYLCLIYNNVKDKEISIPSHTYPSVPATIILSGGRVKFIPSEKYLKGAYRLEPTNIWDSALHFTHSMYLKDSFMCCSFTGPLKHLKLGKGGCILTDSQDAYKWFKKARFSGRDECSYHDDNFLQLGINCYLMPEISARGLLLIQQFYNFDGTPKTNEDLIIPYPDLSKFSIYKSDITSLDKWGLKNE